jgi:hypothetical protein
MSVANTNLEEQQMKLHQFLHKFENRRKYNADAHKGASGNSHLLRTPITSRAEAALPKKCGKRPIDPSSELRDPRSELQRKRKQENQLKYSPANLKVDRERMRSAVQVQIRIQKPEEFEMTTEVIDNTFVAFLLQQIIQHVLYTSAFRINSQYE